MPVVLLVVLVNIVVVGLNVANCSSLIVMLLSCSVAAFFRLFCCCCCSCSCFHCCLCCAFSGGCCAVLVVGVVIDDGGGCGHDVNSKNFKCFVLRTTMKIFAVGWTNQQDTRLRE